MRSPCPHPPLLAPCLPPAAASSGGALLLSFSNRCFPSKAVAVWLRHMEDGAALAGLAADFTHFAAPDGWAHMEAFDISPGEGGGDPLWVLSAVKKCA